MTRYQITVVTEDRSFIEEFDDYSLTRGYERSLDAHLVDIVYKGYFEPNDLGGGLVVPPTAIKLITYKKVDA